MSKYKKYCEELANKIQQEIKRFVTIGKLNGGYTYNKYVIISPTKKEYYDSKKSERWTFKTWQECYQFLEGMKVALNQKEKYITLDAWTSEDIKDIMQDLDVQTLEINEIASIIDQEYDNMLNNVIAEIQRRDKSE